ncbi:MAG: type IV secretory system conjugative DNA transfer family protein [Minisyncoccales bacterium]
MEKIPLDKNVIFIGQTTFRNERKIFGIKNEDRQRHIYIVGKTGTGKSALLKNMVVQDILVGHGIGFFDPHGEIAEELLDFIPSSRINDVVYFNPADLDHPIGFNVLEKVSEEFKPLVASAVLSVFKKIWPDVWSARMEYILSNTILTLLERKDSTILGINRLLSDKDYRKRVVENIKDPLIKSFWEKEFSKYSERYEVEATAAIQNKIGQFIANPLIRNIVGQVKSKISIRKIMDEQKILIANLSKGKIGEENSKLLGGFLIAQLYFSAMSRTDLPEEKRKPFYLYVDEFQNFVTESFVNILSEARKYGLVLILANQYLSQLIEARPEGFVSKIKDAIFGNVGTIITFRVGPEDADFLEQEFYPPFSAQDILNLPRYNIYIKMISEGLPIKPFSGQTLLPFKPPSQTNREKIIVNSRERYATDRRKIEEKIKKWLGENKSLPRTPLPLEKEKRKPFVFLGKNKPNLEKLKKIIKSVKENDQNNPKNKS